MTTYTVRIKRTITGEGTIDADSPEDAKRKIRDQSDGDLLNFYLDHCNDLFDNTKIAHIKKA